MRYCFAFVLVSIPPRRPRVDGLSHSLEVQWIPS